MMEVHHHLPLETDMKVHMAFHMVTLNFTIDDL